MAITYPLSFPTTVAPNSVTIAPRNGVASTESPFSFGQKVYKWAGAEQWNLEVSMPYMKRAVAEEYLAFFAALQGSYGTFTMIIPASKTPRGVATGTPLVNGASQTGTDLVTDGWTHSVTGILKAGDLIQLGSGSSTHLHKLLVDANSDGSGNATLTLWPELRTSPSDNASITVSNCKGLFRLAGDVSHSINIEGFYSIQFTAVEAL